MSEDPDDVSYEVSAIQGYADTASNEAGELLLSLVGDVTRLHVHLLEADAATFRAVNARLAGLRSLVEQLPRKPSLALNAAAKPRLGFTRFESPTPRRKRSK